jgi:hypothetical protein
VIGKCYTKADRGSAFQLHRTSQLIRAGSKRSRNDVASHGSRGMRMLASSVRPHSVSGANHNAPAPPVGVVAAAIGIAVGRAIIAADIDAVVAISPRLMVVAIASRAAVASGCRAAGNISRSTVITATETRRTGET